MHTQTKARLHWLKGGIGNPTARQNSRVAVSQQRSMDMDYIRISRGSPGRVKEADRTVEFRAKDGKSFTTEELDRVRSYLMKLSVDKILKKKVEVRLSGGGWGSRGWPDWEKDPNTGVIRMVLHHKLGDQVLLRLDPVVIGAIPTTPVGKAVVKALPGADANRVIPVRPRDKAPVAESVEPMDAPPMLAVTTGPPIVATPEEGGEEVSAPVDTARYASVLRSLAYIGNHPKLMEQLKAASNAGVTLKDLLDYLTMPLKPT